MYIEQCLARDRHEERLRQAREDRTARHVLALRRLERQQRRAERRLLRVWARADYLRSTAGALS